MVFHIVQRGRFSEIKTSTLPLFDQRSPVDWTAVVFRRGQQLATQIVRKFKSVTKINTSKCDKSQKLNLWPYRNLVCCTESLQQTKKVFVALSHCDKLNLYMLPKSCQKYQQCSTCCTFDLFLALFGNFMPYIAFF